MRVIGHRGAPLLAVENSLQSLQIAVDQGADGVEFDVQLSADGEPVVFHDRDLLRLCGVARDVSTCRWRELRTLSQRTRDLQAQPIAHLDEVLGWWATQPGLANLELKCEARADLRSVQRFAHVVARRVQGLAGRDLVVSSFDRAVLAEFAAVQPGVRRAALVENDRTCAWWPLAQPGSDAAQLRACAADLVAQVHVDQRLLSDAHLATWHAAQWPVWAWTLAQPRDADRLLPWAHAGGLDAVITDDPGPMRRYLERCGVRPAASLDPAAAPPAADQR